MKTRTSRPGRTMSALFAGALAVLAGAPAAAAAERDDLAAKVDVDSVNRHLIALQRIADQNEGNRASGTPGHEASVDYVAGALRAAGFEVDTPTFDYKAYFLDSIELAVGGEAIQADALEYSPATKQGGLDAPLSVARVDDTPGCDPADYGKDVPNSVVLIQRGSCDFATKQRVAAEQGAAAAIIYNNVAGDLNGTLGDPDAGKIPTAGVSKAVGDELANRAGAPVHLDLQARIEQVTSRNVIAQTRTGRTDNVVMAGAHLDSVPDGAGINDNGSGTAGLLETALKLGGSPETNNAIRFAFWGAEESGLVGSTRYVRGLSFEEQLDIALYLNFDMIGSPNAGYFAYDGDGSDGENDPGPVGSGRIEQDFVDAMAANGVELEGTAFDGRSDYGEFIAAGIPSGGLFTGGDEVKTEEQAAKWGGTAGRTFDPNYHTPQDNLSNVDRTALDRNVKGIAAVIEQYGRSTEGVNGERDRAQRAELRQAASSAAPTPTGHGCSLDQR